MTKRQVWIKSEFSRRSKRDTKTGHADYGGVVPGASMDDAILLDANNGAQDDLNYNASFLGSFDECRAQRTHDGTTTPVAKAEYRAVRKEDKSLRDGAGTNYPGGIFEMEPIAALFSEAATAPVRANAAGKVSKGKHKPGASNVAARKRAKTVKKRGKKEGGNET